MRPSNLLLIYQKWHEDYESEYKLSSVLFSLFQSHWLCLQSGCSVNLGSGVTSKMTKSRTPSCQWWKINKKLSICCFRLLRFGNHLLPQKIYLILTDTVVQHVFPFFLLTSLWVLFVASCSFGKFASSILQDWNI